MLKQSLEQRLLQKLSPQQIQMIKLLEVPTMQLEQRIKKEIEENPALEEGNEEEEFEQEEEYNDSESQDEFSIDDYLNDEDTPSYKLMSKNYSSDQKNEEIPFSVGYSFQELLERQLGLRVLTDKERSLAEYLLGNLDEDGYLRRDLKAICNDLAFSQNISVTQEEMEDILLIIQDFDPPGIGARDLQECLYLQIIKKAQSIPEIALATAIIEDHFEAFTKRHYDKIKSKLDIDDELLKQAINEITHLNPRPGGSITDGQVKGAQQIVPDFTLENTDGEFQLQLNAKNVPELRVNKTYSEMLESYAAKKKKSNKSQKEAVSFVKQKLDTARWFIDAMKQRQNTLMVTMNAILEIQAAYFEEGDETKLKPMILKDVAERTGLDISTISRVANSKYIQTHFGIFPLKYFFSEGMQMESGDEVSTRQIKTILEECINNEDKRKPLTDEKLSEILKEKGYNIARRTVAKYREQLNISVARLRKEL
jgi:RNA polymerase sigma-54 factor